MPSSATQCSIIKRLLAQSEEYPLAEGDVYFAVDAAWWAAWAEFTGFGLSGGGGGGTTSMGAGPGEIENTRIVGDGDASAPVAATSEAGETKEEKKGAKERKEAKETKDGISSTSRASGTGGRRELDLSGALARRLKPGLAVGVDVKLVPTEAWRALWHWYGGGPAAARRVQPMLQWGDDTSGGGGRTEGGGRRCRRYCWR